MRENKKIIIAIPIMILLITGIGCSNKGDKHNTDNQKGTSSKIEKTDKHPLTAEDSIKFYSNSFSISGDVEFPLTLTVDSIKKMHVVLLDSLNVVCQSGAIMNQSSASSGVLLKDILNKAGIKQRNHTDRNFYIVVRATDGYKATFSWAEIFNNPTGENTYIIFEENNNPLTKKGAMMLICNNDIKTGPRHVNWLKSIEVNRVD